MKITDGRVIPDFAKDIFAGRDIIMLSDGKPKRTFCYATDALRGYFKVLVRGGAGEPYNIGIDRPEISIAELATSPSGRPRMCAVPREGGAGPQQRNGLPGR